MNQAQQDYLVGIAMGDLSLVRAALDNGVPVDAPIFGHGATALLSAVHGDEELVRFLLERGASVHVEDWEHINPLHEAIRSGNIAVVKLLLAYGANPNHTTPWESALEVAEEIRAKDIAALLREAGATE